MALLALLTEKMTSGDGRVYYGRAVTYRQVSSWFRVIHGYAPCERTLRNWMRALERTKQIAVRMARMRQGMRIFVLSPAKHFREDATRPRQLTLYSEPVQMPVQNSVDMLRNSQDDVRQKVAGASGKKLPEKRSNSKEEIQTTGGLAPASLPRPVKIADLEEFYRLRKVLDGMPHLHPRYVELLGTWQKLGEQIDGEIARRRSSLRREAG